MPRGSCQPHSYPGCSAFSPQICSSHQEEGLGFIANTVVWARNPFRRGEGEHETAKVHLSTWDWALFQRSLLVKIQNILSFGTVFSLLAIKCQTSFFGQFELLFMVLVWQCWRPCYVSWRKFLFRRVKFHLSLRKILPFKLLIRNQSTGQEICLKT